MLTVTVSANVAASWPSQYTKVIADGDAALFGTQIRAQDDGTFEFWVQRPESTLPAVFGNGDILLVFHIHRVK